MGKKKKGKKSKPIKFRLINRDNDEDSKTRHWWEPDNVNTQEDYERMLDFMGHSNMDLLPEEWLPEDYVQPPETNLNMEKLFGDILGNADYDQFIVEEISDDGADMDDDVIFEEDVKAPEKQAQEKAEVLGQTRDLIFVEEGYENHMSIFAYDGLTAVEQDRVLKKLNEPLQKLKKGEELDEVMAALNDPEMFEEANEDWLMGFDAEEEEEDYFWGPPAQTQQTQAQQDSDDELEDKPENLVAQSNQNVENQAQNYEINQAQETDAEFAAMMKDFGDDKIGELDDLDIDREGGVALERHEDLYDQFIEKRAKDWGVAPNQAQKTYLSKYIDNYTEETAEETKVEIDRLTFRKERNRWDCESVITTYSNLENHPSELKVKKIKTRSQIPLKRGVPVFQDEKKEDEDLGLGIIFEQEEESEEELDGMPIVLNTKRERGETKAERKARKRFVKEQRKLARKQKKALKNAFKNEKKQQSKQLVNMKKSHYDAPAI